LVLIANNFKASYTSIIACTTLAANFMPHPLPVWAWQSRVSHRVKNQQFYVSRWSPTISGKKMATLSNIGFL